MSLDFPTRNRARPHQLRALGKVAVIERFRRSAMELIAVQLLPPLSPKHLDDRLGPALAHHSFHRPHQGLGGATSAERYFVGRKLAVVAEVPCPTPALAIKPPGDLPYRLAYLDAERRYPVLVEHEKIAA